MLSGSGLRKSFDNKAVLDNLSISIERGSITALLGETGVGKSTLLRALAMIDPPEAGAIELDGEVYQYPLHSRIPPRPWPKLGVEFQDLFLWPHLTIRDNILLLLRLNNVTGASELLAEVSNEFHICDLLDRYPNQVSRGQRQAVAIARALALKPRYILLDEITASLDFLVWLSLVYIDDFPVRLLIQPSYYHSLSL